MQKTWRPEIITLAAAVFIVGVLNLPFWSQFFAAVQPQRASEWAFTAAAAAALVVIANLLLTLFAQRPVLRVLLAILLPVSAGIGYFMHEYGVVIDVNMIRNLFETDTREAGDLITLKLVAWVALLGILPALLVWRLNWQERTWAADIKAKLAVAAVSVPLIGALLFPFWGNFLSLFREHRELRMTLMPYNYISALSKYAESRTRGMTKAVAPFGEDARKVPGAPGRKTLFVIVVGETARWDHSSLNGYERQTNPELAKVSDLINYPQAYSCGTDTAQSVPCMFSGLGRDAFTNSKAAARENLLDVLKRAGFDVIWRENQSGCKGVCARVTNEVLTGLKHPTFYARTENHDEILIDDLDARIAKLERDTVIVMHMMGSHGPAYWKRYPDRFEVFKPVCRESQFSRCTREEIINAYDNTMLYSDYVLAGLIGKLKGADAHGVDAGMIYMSDHGESLGEGNLYLHGMPYGLAPEAQVRVPAVAWLSPQFMAARGLKADCLQHKAAARTSHDNLFHSVLGVLQVETKVYDAALDVLGTCR